MSLELLERYTGRQIGNTVAIDQQAKFGAQLQATLYGGVFEARRTNPSSAPPLRLLSTQTKDRPYRRGKEVARRLGFLDTEHSGAFSHHDQTIRARPHHLLYCLATPLLIATQS